MLETMSLLDEWERDAAKGEEVSARAANWAKDNWGSFCAVMRYLESEALSGNPHLTRSDVLAECRRGGIELNDGGEFKRDHNLYSALVRYMVMIRPEIKAVVSFRASACDAADMAGIWERTMPHIPLKARSWESA